MPTPLDRNPQFDPRDIALTPENNESTLQALVKRQEAPARSTRRRCRGCRSFHNGQEQTYIDPTKSYQTYIFM